MPVTVRVYRARDLPAPRFLANPNPYVEVHYFPGAPPVVKSTPARRTIDPEWTDAVATISNTASGDSPALIGIVIRDADYRDAVLGRCVLRVNASVTEGWFPLDGDLELEGPKRSVTKASRVRRRPRIVEFPDVDRSAYSNDSAEVYVRIESQQFSRRSAMMIPTRFEVLSKDADEIEPEIRAVADEPGRFFRCGELLVSIKARGVPTNHRSPMLMVAVGDQRLRGYENLMETQEALDSDQDEADALGDAGHQSSVVLSGASAARHRPDNTRKDIDFGLFSFALMHGAMPDNISLKLRDRSAGSASNTAAHEVPLPVSVPGDFEEDVKSEMDSGTPEASSTNNSHRQTRQYVLHRRETTRGQYNAKVVFDLRITYATWKPTATCTYVTPRFREVFLATNENPTWLKKSYPECADLHYLFVGGLFTDHYPRYFDFNRSFLGEELGCKNIHVVPIHTEMNTVANAAVIRDTVLECARGRANSVVLIGHSKGGVDICCALDHPDILPLLFGIVSFQGPFGGTFLVDYLASKNIPLLAIDKALKSLWGGEKESLLDLSYASRGRQAISPPSSIAESAEEPASAGNSEPEVVEDKPGGPVLDDSYIADRLRLYAKLPIVSLASYAEFSAQQVRTVSDAAGFASMALTAKLIADKTGFMNDGLVSPWDAQIPYSDVVLVPDMMHTEPAFYLKGTKYPPGRLTAAVLALLFEKRDRMRNAQGAS